MVTTLAVAQPAESVRKVIEASYVRSLAAFRNAKSIEDLDETSRTFDTADWLSITPGQKPNHRAGSLGNILSRNSGLLFNPWNL